MLAYLHPSGKPPTSLSNLAQALDQAAQACPKGRSQHERLLAEARRLLGAPGLDGYPGDLDSITLPRHAADGAVDTEGGRLEVSRNGRVRARPLSWWAGERLMYASKAVGVQGVHAGSPCGDLIGTVQLDRPERCGTCIACTGGEESGECVTLQALRIMLGGGQQREAAAPAAVPAAKGRKRPAKATRGAGPKPAERSKRARAARPESSRSGSEEAAGGDGCSRPGAPPASTSCSPQAPGNEGPPPADEAWTREQVQALQAACLQVDPATTNFWSVVAAKAAMRRVVRLAQREARWEGEAAEASPSTLERVAERRADQAARDKLIDQIFRKRGGQAWGGVLAQGLAGPRAREAGAAQLEAGDAQRAVRGLLAQEPAPALSDDSEEEVDYYWSDA
ncbi:hypothetical protein F751_6542 [Auxenochlorella protothecoides]|uniref:Uncharacterized protein n=1 Tax=Auxenochlorella protothecoides TaxID=3075 RepID=A0A087STG9_AUXPR|nr:hypothetical protein F751_6542 [Auxenochlorella protothecoides]KFM29023.1 hypothetical protein F751_6542 [Auxenochlorella protothecoides]